MRGSHVLPETIPVGAQMETILIKMLPYGATIGIKHLREEVDIPEAK
jgi:hypothetical protein